MNGGFIYTPEDPKDYPICMAYEDSEEVQIPQSFRTSFQPPYANQGSTGNCVAQTLANIMEVIYHNKLGVHEDFSVGFIYGNRKPGQSKSSGMTGYMACGNLCEDGDVKSAVYDDPSEMDWIMKDVDRFKFENPDWVNKAYKPREYIRTNSTKEVKKFIMKYNIPVMAVVKVSKFWFGEGYHAMALYGWDGDTAIMQNSWGERSNAKTVELDFDDIKEFWLIVPYTLPGFTDVAENHWAYKDIIKCAEKAILQGYPDGTFQPDKTMTRAELCAMIYRMLKGE